MGSELRDKIRAIEALRGALGLTQAQVAEMLGHTQTWVANVLDVDNRAKRADEIIEALKSKYKDQIGDDKLLKHILVGLK